MATYLFYMKINFYFLAISGEDRCLENNPCSENEQCLSPFGADEVECVCKAAFAGNLCQCEYF